MDIHIIMAKSYNVIFGLTADPIHKGHEQAIINGVSYLRTLEAQIDRFILIPVYKPHLISGKNKPIAQFEQRVKMCEIVANRLSKQLGCQIEVSQVEKRLAQTTGNHNFSINTLHYLNLKNSLFMVSADHFKGRWPKFRQWYKWRELLSVSGLLINQRPQHKINLNFIKQLKTINPDIFISQSKKQINISSSEIRNNLNSKSILNVISEDIYPLVVPLYSNPD